MSNIVNPQQLQQAIVARNQQRAPSVQRWLGNQFRRWAIGHFEQLEPVGCNEDFQRLVGGAVPFWFSEKLAGGESFYYLDPNHPKLRELESKLAEYLNTLVGSNEEHKFPRYTVAQVLEKWQRAHNKQYKKQAKGWCETDGSAVREVFAVGDYRFVEFIGSGRRLRAEMSNESFYMQHCVGRFENLETLSGGYGEQYAQAIEDGRLRVFSLRDALGQPHATLSFELGYDKVTGRDSIRIEQIKGKQNKPPIARYVPVVIELLNYLGINDLGHYDCHMMGVFLDKGKACYVTDIQDPEKLFQAISVHPQLILQLPEVTPALRWAALRCHPGLIEKLPDCSTAQLFSAGQWLNGQVPSALATAEPSWLREAVSGRRSIEIERKVLSVKPLADKPISPWRRFMNRWEAVIQKLPKPLVALLGVVALVIVLLAIIPVIVAALGIAIYQVWRDRIKGQLKDRADWAMGLAGIFIYRFDDNPRRFNTDPPAEEFQRRQQMLARDWGIGGAEVPAEKCREQCLEQIRSMWRDGHTGSFSYRPSPDYSVKDVLAFDLTRMGLLVRTGVLLGYISEEEGWNYMYCGAAQAQDIFDSWDDYGKCYIRGRSWWAGENPQSIHDEYKAFRADKDCTWNTVPWSDFDVFVADEDHFASLS